MKLSRRTLLASGAGLLAASLGARSFAAGTVVMVKLWDEGPASMSMLGHGMMMGTGMGMGMTGGAMHHATMGIDAVPQAMPAGEITFEVTNVSTNMVHEMVVAPVKNPNRPLPYDESAQKVDEDAAGHLGEVAELEPGQSGALRLTLKPGTYILYCNIAGHYVLGMWTLITVSA